MLADTAKLAIELNLTGNAAAGIAGVERRLAGLNRQSGQIGQGFRTMGAGVGVLARNLLLLGGAAVGGLAAGLFKSIREGQAAAKVQTIYANAVANSGKVSTQYIDILAKQRTALMNLAGIDDELIQTTQTRLIQMGLTGKQVATLTPLILDMSKATGKDLATSTIAVGKAASGSATSLQRFGVFVNKAKFELDPFGATMDALNHKFGGTTQALSGTLDTRLGAFRANLANIREEAGIRLLPALTRIVDVVGTQLVPAFGKFVTGIMPGIISGINRFALMLENGGAERGIKAITDALGPMVDLLKIAAAPVKAIVSAFLSLPAQVQGVLIGAFAINKLSGGLLGKGALEVGKGVVGGLLSRGGTPANPLFVSEVGLKNGIPLIAGAGALGVGTIAALVAIPAAVIGLTLAVSKLTDPTGARNDQGRIDTARARGIPEWNIREGPALRRIGDFGAPHPGSLNSGMPSTPVPVTIRDAGGRNLMSTFSADAVRLRAIAAGFRGTDRAVQNTLQRNAERLALAQRVATARTTTAVNTLPEKLAARLQALLLRGSGGTSGGGLMTPGGTPGIRNGFVVQPPQLRNGFTVNVNATVKDVSNAQVVRSRWGPTAAQAGAA